MCLRVSFQCAQYLSPAPPKWLLHVQKDDPRTVSGKRALYRIVCACHGRGFDTTWSCLLTEFASLTHAQLMEKVRALQNLAYRLGVEEGNSIMMVLLWLSMYLIDSM